MGIDLNTQIDIILFMIHREDYIGFQLKPGESESIEQMAQARGLNKAEMGRALLRAGKILFEQAPDDVITLAKVRI